MYSLSFSREIPSPKCAVLYGTTVSVGLMTPYWSSNCSHCVLDSPYRPVDSTNCPFCSSKYRPWMKEGSLRR